MTHDEYKRYGTQRCALLSTYSRAIGPAPAQEAVVTGAHHRRSVAD